jgi:hypothetical protein
VHHGEHHWSQQILLHKNIEKGFEFKYMGAFVELCVVAFFSFNFWLAMLVIS